MRETTRKRAATASGALAVLAAAALLAHGAGAAVICQKGNRVKLRADACKPGWTELAVVGDTGPADPSGIWEYQSGTLFDVTGLSPRFLVLEPEGSGRLNLSGGDGGVLTCGTFNYARATTPTLTLDLQSVGYLPTSVYRYGLDGSDALDLVDASGRTAHWTRASAVAPESECGTLSEIALFAGLPQPEYWSGLAFDGAQLWYEIQNLQQIVPLDPGTGAVGLPQPFGDGQFTHPHAYDSGALWTHCACGGSEEAGLVTIGGSLVDEVQTLPELGESLGVRAIAYDPIAPALWLHGYAESGQRRLLQVDPSSEPDVLVAGFELDADFTGLAFDGTHLWGLNRSGRSLARIDPATGQATGNFKIPNAIADWRGVAVVGSELVLLGDTGLEGVLLKVALPTP